MGAAAIPVAMAMYSTWDTWQQGDLAGDAGRRNMIIARQAEMDALARGELEASRVRSQGVRLMAKAKAAMLAQGQHAEGSGLADLLVGMATNIELDAETVKNNAARQAWGYRNQADTALFEGEIAEYRSIREGVGAFLGGAGKGAAGGAQSGMGVK